MENLIGNLKKLIKRFYNNALYSIAFYPILIGLSLFVFALITLSLESTDIILDLKRTKPNLFIEDVDTARSILSTLITGILSLTVFSFTMVMVVLSQASSNFSPRLLPGLVSNRKHQLILGSYIGTLLYITVILIFLGASKLNEDSVGMSTTIAAIFGICCVVLFVSFIHSISCAIQIQNIVSDIVRSTNKELENNLKEQVPKAMSSSESMNSRFEISSREEGYFQEFDTNLLDQSIIKNDLKLVVVPHSGRHVNKGDVLLIVDSLVTKEEEQTLIFACIITSDLHEIEHPLLGLIKLMEVAVRAMSPGINDPGTALDVIHKLAPLLSKAQGLPPYYRIVVCKNSKIEVLISNISTQQLLKEIIQPIRFYVKEDARLMTSLLHTLQYLNQKEDISHTDTIAIQNSIEALTEDVSRFISNTRDKDEILKSLRV